MKITYEQRLFRDWPANIRAKLRKMTLDAKSGMSVAIKWKRSPPTWVAFDNSIPIAWALLFEAQDRASFGFEDGTVMVYVKARYRRKGIGTNLISLIEENEIKECIYHDEKSDYFWHKVIKDYNKIFISCAL